MLRTLGPALAACAFAMVVLLVVTPPDEWWIAGIVGVVLLVSLGIAAWLVTLTKLVVSPEGITYHAIGYRVTGTWSDVTGYAERVMGASSPESLILRKPGIHMSGWMSFTYRLVPFLQVVSALDGRYIPASLTGIEDAIPVGLFDHEWRTGELGSIIRGYAPAAIDTKVA
jgi:hypothetical protein